MKAFRSPAGQGTTELIVILAVILGFFLAIYWQAVAQVFHRQIDSLSADIDGKKREDTTEEKAKAEKEKDKEADAGPGGVGGTYLPGSFPPTGGSAVGTPGSNPYERPASTGTP